MFTLRALREASVPLLLLLAFVLCFLILVLTGHAWGWWGATLFAVLMACTTLFFRDPIRGVPLDPRAILAPADGKVVAIDAGAAVEFVPGPARRISIFLSVFDVHVQRAPIRGRIAVVQYRPGGHLDARDPDASMRNENRLVAMEAEDGFRLVVRQIAGKIARRIVGWSGEGASLLQGERLGMIRFGSRVDLFLPAETEILVRMGEHVKGGETVLARRP